MNNLGISPRKVQAPVQRYADTLNSHRAGRDPYGMCVTVTEHGTSFSLYVMIINYAEQQMQGAPVVK